MWSALKCYASLRKRKKRWKMTQQTLEGFLFIVEEEANEKCCFFRFNFHHFSSSLRSHARISSFRNLFKFDLFHTLNYIVCVGCKCCWTVGSQWELSLSLLFLLMFVYLAIAFIHITHQAFCGVLENRKEIAISSPDAFISRLITDIF